ncbi:hypothetical protein AQUCO_00600188v1 [Aquilegia coerulea]|uniref:Uncharacterized protein n=1 Tax=Aquilegia coerulea TaxID=218851 RepID=A0A2G5ENY6_AQUCA|nr:hypothetical protein AQUCO_00600188v1 [Aquilegia coerulea]
MLVNQAILYKNFFFVETFFFLLIGIIISFIQSNEYCERNFSLKLLSHRCYYVNGTQYFSFLLQCLFEKASISRGYTCLIS